MRREAADVKSGGSLNIRTSAEYEMDIIVAPTARDPLDPDVQPHVLLKGTLMAPLTSGQYAPIRRTTLTSAMAATAVAQVADARPFTVGDVVAIFTVTNVVDIATIFETAKTIAAVSTTANTLTFTAPVPAADTGAYVEVAENGHLAFLADPTSYDAVVLLEDVQNQSDPPTATTIAVPARGAVGGVVRAAELRGPSGAGPDPLIEYSMRRLTVVPATPGS